MVSSLEVGCKYTKAKLHEFSNNYNFLYHNECRNLEFLSVAKSFNIFRNCCSCRVNYLDCYLTIKFKNLEFFFNLRIYLIRKF